MVVDAELGDFLRQEADATGSSFKAQPMQSWSSCDTGVSTEGDFVSLEDEEELDPEEEFELEDEFESEELEPEELDPEELEPEEFEPEEAFEPDESEEELG